MMAVVYIHLSWVNSYSDERMTFTMVDEGGSIYGWSYLVEDMYGDPIMEGGDETTNGFENIISFIKNWADNDS